MQKQKQLVNLYIHPLQGGPVTLLRWEVPAIYELLGEGFSAEQDWPKLRYIAQHLVMLDPFDGIVLQLSGTIVGEAEKTKKEMEEIQKEIDRLHQALQSERQQ